MVSRARSTLDSHPEVKKMYAALLANKVTAHILHGL